MKTNFTIELAFFLLTGSLFAQSNPVPFVDVPLAPTSTKPGAAGFTLTVRGADFVSGSVVNWNRSPRSTTFVSRTELTAVISAGDVASKGTSTITVSNPGPGGGISNAVLFSIVNQEPAVGFSTQPVCGQSPSISADFNSDGKADLATLQNGNQLLVQLGRGNGTFQAGSVYITPRTPTAAVAGDFDGDGNLDIAVASLTGFNVAIYLGNGDGTFRSKGTFNVDMFPGSLAVGDFNEDGKLDIAVGSTSNGGNRPIALLLGNGDGTFQLQTVVPVGGPYILVVGDFNHAGHLDIATPEGVNHFASVRLGNGDGTFQAPIDTPDLGGELATLAAADLNSDGNLDLVADVAIGKTSNASVLLGNGDGTFKAPVAYAWPSANGNFVMADFSGSGNLDLVKSGSVPPELSILRGRGDGTFNSPITFATSGSALSLVAGDFNGDGKMDVDNGCALLQTPRAITLSPMTDQFSLQTVGTSSTPKQVRLLNAGSQAVAISSITTAGDFSQTNSCPATLNSQQACMIEVTFSPIATGTRTGSLLVADNAANSPQSVALSGTSTALTLAPQSLNFGSEPVGQTSPPQTATLTNVSSGITVSISNIGVKGAENTDFAESTTCGATLAPGASCAINVTFTPTQTGSRSAHVSVVDDGGGLQNIALSGAGT